MALTLAKDESGEDHPRNRPVTASDPDPAAAILLRCPACGTSEEADPAVLADAPTIVCRDCGETWPDGPRRAKRRALVRAAEPAGGLIEAERRPLVSYASGTSEAWAAKIAGDILPKTTHERSRLPMTAAAFAALLFIGAFLGGREAAVRAVPDLAGLYAGIGLGVDLDGLVIEDVAAERTAGDAGDRIVVRGEIRNTSGAEQVAPPLAVTLRDEAGASAGIREFDPPARSIAPGAAEPFVLEIGNAERQAREIVLRFARPAEAAPAPTGGAAADL
jgi:hypothetical protein